MRVMVTDDFPGCAHYYQRLAWLNAFSSFGMETRLCTLGKESFIDVLEEFEPDILLGQSYNLKEEMMSRLVAYIEHHPGFRLALRAFDWGEYESDRVKSRYGICFASDQQKRLVGELRDKTGLPDFLHIQYGQDAMFVLTLVSVYECANPSVVNEGKGVDVGGCGSVEGLVPLGQIGLAGLGS